MDAELIKLIGVAVGSPLILEIARAILGRKNEQIDSATRFYSLWNENMSRLESRINEMQVHIEVLEEHISDTGGDIVGIRLEVARRLEAMRHGN